MRSEVCCADEAFLLDLEVRLDGVPEELLLLAAEDPGESGLLEDGRGFLVRGGHLADVVLVQLDHAGAVVELDLAELHEVEARVAALLPEQVDDHVAQGRLQQHRHFTAAY